MLLETSARQSRATGLYSPSRIHIMQILLADAIYSWGFRSPSAFFPVALFRVFRSRRKKPRRRISRRDLDFRTAHVAPVILRPKRSSEAATESNSEVRTWTPFFRPRISPPGALGHMLSIVSASARRPFVTDHTYGLEAGGQRYSMTLQMRFGQSYLCL